MRFKKFMVLSIALCMFFGKVQAFEKYVLNIGLFTSLNVELAEENDYASPNEFYNVQKSMVNNDKGIGYLENGEFEKAKVFFFKKVKENKNDVAANHYLGRTYFFLQNYDKAIEYLEKAIKMNSQIADYHYWLGRTLGAKAQNSNILKQALIAPEILKEFKRTVELNSNHIGGHKGLASFYIQAPSFLGGDIEEARKETKILFKLDRSEGLLQLIDIYEKENKLDLAEKAYIDYDKSYKETMGNNGFYNKYGYFLLAQKKYAKAIEMFQKQVRLAPDIANSHDSLGDGYRAAGRIKEAIAEYKKAAELDPQFESSLKKVQELKKQLTDNN